MNKLEHYKMLVKLNQDGFQLKSYLGIHWFVGKIALLVFSIIMFIHGETLARSIGFVIVGYLIATVYENWRTFDVSKSDWNIQRELIDWDKVTSYLDELESKD